MFLIFEILEEGFWAQADRKAAPIFRPKRQSLRFFHDRKLKLVHFFQPKRLDAKKQGYLFSEKYSFFTKVTECFWLDILILYRLLLTPSTLAGRRSMSSYVTEARFHFDIHLSQSYLQDKKIIFHLSNVLDRRTHSRQ